MDKKTLNTENNSFDIEKNEKPKPTGGMYRGVDIPIKLLNMAILIGLITLAVAIIFLTSKGIR